MHPPQLFWSDETVKIHDETPGFAPEVSDAINFYKPEYRDVVTQEFSHCVNDGKSFDLITELVTKTGRELWVRSIGEAERDAQGDDPRTWLDNIHADDYEWVHNEYFAAMNNPKTTNWHGEYRFLKADGQLTGGVAHDFNNLLTVILGNAELISEQLDSDHPLKGLADKTSRIKFAKP